MTSSQQNYEDTLRTAVTELTQEVNDLLPENTELKVVHISHLLKSAGLTHYRQYDKSKINGISLGLLTDSAGTIKVYPAIFNAHEAYNTSEGNLKLLSEIKANLVAFKAGEITRRFEPITVDVEEAFKYLPKPLDANSKTIRAVVDWFITKHVNKKSTAKAGPALVTREKVAEHEQELIEIMEEQLNNQVELRFVYSYETVAGKRNSTTEVSRIGVEIKDRKNLTDADVKTLEAGLELVKEEVIRYVDDSPNRLLARLALLHKVAERIA